MKKKIHRKIIFFCNESSFINSHRSDLINFLLKKKFKIKIITFINRKLNIQSKLLEVIDYKIQSGFSLFNNFKTIKFYRKIIKNNSNYIVHIIGLKCIVLSLLASINIRRNLIFHFTGLGVIFSDKKLFIIRLVVVLLIRNLISKHNHNFIFQKAEDAEKVLGKYKFLYKKNINIIPGSGVNTKLFKKNTIRDNNKLNILMASRIIKHKGIDVFLDLVRNFKNQNHFNFYFAGIHEYKFNQFDIKNILKIKQKNFKFLGEVKNMKKLLEKIDIVVYPSKYGEGIPKFLIECMSCGIPILGYRTDTNKYLIFNNKSGFFCNNHDEYAINIKKLQDYKLRKKFSNFSRKYCINQFDISKINLLHLNLYNSINFTTI